MSIGRIRRTIWDTLTESVPTPKLLLVACCPVSMCNEATHSPVFEVSLNNTSTLATISNF